MSIAILYKWAANPQDAEVQGDGEVNWSRAKKALSEYDPVAIEMGCQLAQTLSTKALGVTVAEKEGASPLAKKNVLSRGLDEILLHQVDHLSDYNPTVVATLLVAMIKQIEDCQLIITGDASVDEGQKLIPSLVVAGLGVPIVTEVMEIKPEGSGWIVKQRVGSGSQTLEVNSRFVAQMTSDALIARIPGMKDILQAGKKPLNLVEVSESTDQARPNLVETRRPESKARVGEIFEGADAAHKLITVLRDKSLI